LDWQEWATFTEEQQRHLIMRGAGLPMTWDTLRGRSGVARFTGGGKSYATSALGLDMAP